jgi:hypothetical protein
MEQLITEKDIIMRGGAAAAAAGTPVPDYKIKVPPNQYLDAQLFQILEIGVNTMVEQIKEKLGTNIPDTHSNAKVIMELLNTLKTKIDGPFNDSIIGASDLVTQSVNGTGTGSVAEAVNRGNCLLTNSTLATGGYDAWCYVAHE